MRSGAVKIGEVFTKLTVEEVGEADSKGLRFITCRCECGNVRQARSTLLRSGRTRGCLTCFPRGRPKKPRKEPVKTGKPQKKPKRALREQKWRKNTAVSQVVEGAYYKDLLVLKDCAKPDPKTGRWPSDSNRPWACLCKCDNLCWATGSKLAHGKKKSCGCRNTRRLQDQLNKAQKALDRWLEGGALELIEISDAVNRFHPELGGKSWGTPAKEDILDPKSEKQRLEDEARTEKRRAKRATGAF